MTNASEAYLFSHLYDKEKEKSFSKFAGWKYDYLLDFLRRVWNIRFAEDFSLKCQMIVYI